MPQLVQDSTLPLDTKASTDARWAFFYYEEDQEANAGENYFPKARPCCTRHSGAGKDPFGFCTSKKQIKKRKKQQQQQ